MWAPGFTTPKYMLSKTVRSEAIDSVYFKLTHDITKAIWLELIL